MHAAALVGAVVLMLYSVAAMATHAPDWILLWLKTNLLEDEGCWD